MQARIKTDADRLAFALRFATAPLPRSKSELELICRNVTAFLGMSRGTGDQRPGGFGIAVKVVGSPQPWEYTIPLLRELQQEARHLIEQTVDGHGIAPTILSDSQELIVDVVGQADDRTLRIGGSVKSGFLLTLALLLAGMTDAPPLLKCPECGTLFIRKRRQKYCDSKCTNRATWRNYPDELKLKARQKLYDDNNWTLGARGGMNKPGRR